MLDGNYMNGFIVILYFIVIGEYIKSYDLSSKFKGLASKDPLEKELTKASLLSEAFTTYLTTNLVTMFFSFIKEIMRLLLIFVFAVPTGSLLCVVYFLWISIVTNFSTLVWGNSKNFKNLVDFIRSDTSGDSSNDPCNIPTTFWEKFIYGVKNGFLYLSTFSFNYFIYIIIISYCIYVLVSGLGKFNGNLMQQLIESFHIIILIITFLLLSSQIFKLYKNMGENFSLFNVLVLGDIVDSMEGTAKNIGYVISFFAIIFTIFIIVGSSIIIDESRKGSNK
jgi:hypothetical protein